VSAKSTSSQAAEKIPFYRNVKMIGALAQIIFVIIFLLLLAFMVTNVLSSLKKANIPADFSFLSRRAGIPISESPIRYNSQTDTYARAFLVGVLNTLKVSLLGVVLATILGILIGVMRLSSNWILKQIATVYVEIIRNTPLAVQIVFWTTAVLLVIPPRSLNPVKLFGGGYYSNLGLALPWLFPSYQFMAWLPWLIAALVLAIVAYGYRRRQIIKSELPGNPWPPAIATFILVSLASYFLLASSSKLPDKLVTTINPKSGVVHSYLDSNDNGEQDADEKYLTHIKSDVNLAEGRMTVNTQTLTESRKIVYSEFRFPPILQNEFDKATVDFADPEAAKADGLKIHFYDEPSRGVVYKDLNSNGKFDSGEERFTEGEKIKGYSTKLVLDIENFRRTVVTDRDGNARIPRFKHITDTTAKAVESGPSSLFGGPTAAKDENIKELEFDVKPVVTGPLVLSKPSIPISQYFGGMSFSAAYLGLLLALVIYTASFISELVRAGIMAVPKGQTEAAKAVGLNGLQTFNMIIFPQAMRIIMPPMISQFLNLTKNSSLGVLAGFAEIVVIANIIGNQTGANVPTNILIIGSYLTISFAFAIIMNAINSKMAIVER